MKVEAVFSGKKMNRIKRHLWQEVFEDNMRIIGKDVDKRKNVRILRILISSLSLSLVIFYIGWRHFSVSNRSFFQYSEKVGGPGTGNIALLMGQKSPAASTVADYKSFLSNSHIPLKDIFALKVKRIVIDPGHGGKDPGATGRLGTREKNITLDVAFRLRDRLIKHKGFQILMTRENDSTLSLEDRIAFANVQKADLYISIHVNYIPSKPINVIETYYFGLNLDRAAVLLAERENEGSHYRFSDFKEIIQKIGSTFKAQESGDLAFSIQSSLYRNIRLENRNTVNFGIKTAPLVVLLGVEVPCVLTEVTCLSDDKEEAKLNREEYRENIASYLEEGIVNYLNRRHNGGEV